MCRHFSLYIKVGQILELSKNGSWDLVDAHRFFFPNILLFDLFFAEKVKEKVSGAFDTPNIKVGQMGIFGKIGHGPQLMPATAFFDFFPI